MDELRVDELCESSSRNLEPPDSRSSSLRKSRAAPRHNTLASGNPVVVIKGHAGDCLLPDGFRLDWTDCPGEAAVSHCHDIE